MANFMEIPTGLLGRGTKFRDVVYSLVLDFKTFTGWSGLLSMAYRFLWSCILGFI